MVKGDVEMEYKYSLEFILWLFFFKNVVYWMSLNNNVSGLVRRYY